jgi:sugar lactone lactonase YvrE
VVRFRLMALASSALLIFALSAPPPLVAATRARGGSSLTPQVVATFPTGVNGAFAESLAVDRYGRLYASVTTWAPDFGCPGANTGQIWRIAPDGTKSPFGPSFTVSCILSGLAFDDAGNLYAGVATFDENAPPWIARFAPDGTMTKVASLGNAIFPNGLAFKGGYLYVSDPIAGAIWRFQPRTGVIATPSEPWLSDQVLAPVSALGVDGITFKGNTLYGINYDAGTLFTVPLVNGAPGPVSVLVTDPNLVTGDGVVFDENGTLWVAVNTGAIVTVGRDTSVSVLAIPANSLDYPTQAVFGTGNNRTTLFVTNGSFDLGTPNLIAIDIGPRG